VVVSPARRGFFGALLVSPAVALAGITQARVEATTEDAAKEASTRLTLNGGGLNVWEGANKNDRRHFQIRPECLVEVKR